jgi:hypothetical protein
MRKPKQNETISQFAIRTAWEYGHFWNPDFPEGQEVKQSDLKKLSPSDPIVVKAMISLSKMDMTRYTRHVLDKHGRPPDFDGAIGPAMVSMMMDEGDAGRCPVPDFAPPKGVVFAFDDPDLQQVVLRMQNMEELPALGNGGWPGCHGIGNFHCKTILVNTSGVHSRVLPLLKQILTNVRNAYAGIGLLNRYIGTDGFDMLSGEKFTGQINSDLSFVQRSDGWIGLAIVGQRQSCSSRIWQKILATYLGGNTDLQIVNQITTLIAHEDGHNNGLLHSSGGVMNPSIVNNLPVGVWPESDPSTRILKKEYGGVPVPIPGGGPIPPDKPTPSTIEQRMLAMEIQQAVNKVTMDWCVGEIKKLKGM